MIKTIKLAVVGSDTFDDYSAIRRMIDQYSIEFRIESIVLANHEDCNGAAKRVADELGLEIKICEIKSKPKGYEFTRNKKIAAEADVILAFWNEESEITQHMIETCNKLGKTLILYSE